MALQTRISRRQWVILKNLGEGNTEWDDLSFENKYRAYQTGIDLTDTVEDKKIQEFKRELQARKGEGDSNVIGRMIESFTKGLPK